MAGKIFMSFLRAKLSRCWWLAGDTFNIFLLPGILNINIFLIKKKNNVVVTSKVKKNITQKIY